MIVYKSELSGGSARALLDILTKESDESTALKSAINDFIALIDAGKLSGPGYDSVRNRASLYIPILDKRIQLASELASGIESALAQMDAYMGGDSMLDDSELPELRAALSAAQSALDSLLSNTVLTDEIMSAAYAYMEEIKVLKQKIEKLELLAPTDASAYSKVTAVLGNISQYQLSVSSVSSNVISIPVDGN